MKIEATLDGVRIFTPDRVPWTLETLHTQRGTQESAQQVMRKDLIAIAFLYCCSIRTSQTNPFKTSDRYCSRPADSMSSIFHQGERRAQVTSRGMDPAIVNSLSPRPNKSSDKTFIIQSSVYHHVQELAGAREFILQSGMEDFVRPQMPQQHAQFFANQVCKHLDFV